MRKFLVLIVLALGLAAPAAATAHSTWHNKVNVCVTEQGKERTVSIDKHALNAFLRAHPGSYQGECKPTPPPVTPVTPTDVPHDNNIALCYSAFQVDPLWSNGYADAVFDVTTYGWTEPVAVAGNVSGGTNVGTYHLTCQKTGVPTGSFVGGSGGAVFGPEYASLASTALGFYPIVQ